jgi:ribosomal protein S26
MIYLYKIVCVIHNLLINIRKKNEGAIKNILESKAIFPQYCVSYPIHYGFKNLIS